jgi:hypothetical protein
MENEGPQERCLNIFKTKERNLDAMETKSYKFRLKRNENNKKLLKYAKTFL